MRRAVVFTAKALFILLGIVRNNAFAVGRIVRASAARIFADRSWQWIPSIARWCAIAERTGRSEFTSASPISSGVAVGSGGKRGPSTVVRVSAKQAKAPTVLLPEQVKLALTMLEFRDQLLVLLDGALGTRRGELAASRWQDSDFENCIFQIQHSYNWPRGGLLKDKNGSFR